MTGSLIWKLWNFEEHRAASRAIRALPNAASKSTKKKSRKGPNLKKNDFAINSLLLYVKKYLNNFCKEVSEP